MLFHALEDQNQCLAAGRGCRVLPCDPIALLADDAGLVGVDPVGVGAPHDVHLQIVAGQRANPDLHTCVIRHIGLRSAIRAWTSVAQRSGSTTLLNSTRSPPPVVLTSRTLCVAIVRSMSTARNGSEACKVPALASSDQPRGAYDVRRQDPGKTAGGGHSSGTPAWRNPTITVFSRSPQY